MAASSQRFPDACRLCGTIDFLRESHIIPRFVTQWQKKTGTGYLRHLREPNKRQQDGLKLHLLCDSCEQLFSRVERWFNEHFFAPYLNKAQFAFDYGPELYQFLLSVLWRVAVVADVDPRHADLLADVRTDWARALRGGRSATKYPAVHMVITDMGLVGGDVPVVNFNRYLARAVDSTVATNETKAFVYAKMGRFIAFGELTPLSTGALVNTRISPEGAKYRTAGVVVAGSAAEFLLNRAAGSHEQYERSLTSRERERIDRTTRERLAPGSDLATAIRTDGLSRVKPPPTMLARVGRNERCPCGSGRKFKRCHGSDS